MQRETGSDNQNDPIEPISSIGEQEDIGVTEELFWERGSNENRLTRELDGIVASLGMAFKKEAQEVEKQFKAIQKMKGM